MLLQFIVHASISECNGHVSFARERWVDKKWNAKLPLFMWTKSWNPEKKFKKGFPNHIRNVDVCALGTQYMCDNCDILSASRFLHDWESVNCNTKYKIGTRKKKSFIATEVFPDRHELAIWVCHGVKCYDSLWKVNMFDMEIIHNQRTADQFFENQLKLSRSDGRQYQHESNALSWVKWFLYSMKPDFARKNLDFCGEKNKLGNCPVPIAHPIWI